jgi:hypothetical protein
MLNSDGAPNRGKDFIRIERRSAFQFIIRVRQYDLLLPIAAPLLVAIAPAGSIRVPSILDLDHHDQLLVAIHLRGEGGRGARSDPRMTSLNGCFNVVGKQVLPVKDDAILQASADKDVAPDHQPQIAATQEWALSGVSKLCVEALAGFFLPLPVSATHTRSGDPDLSDITFKTAHSGFGIDD